MDIYKLLKSDHDKVKVMLATIEKEKDRELFKELKKEVTVHAEAEEEAFYKPLEKKAGKLKIMVDTGHEEHDLTMEMMKQMDKIQDEEEWMSLFAVVKKSLESHILMEEDDIFSLSKKHFSSDEAKKMGEDMSEEKEKMEKKYKD